MMPLALKQNPELAEWATRHGLDPSRIPVREFDVRSAATREHPRQVRVDYVALLLDAGGSIVGRDARTLLTCDPPPGLYAVEHVYPSPVLRFVVGVERPPRTVACPKCGSEAEEPFTHYIACVCGRVYPTSHAVQPLRVTTWCDECGGPHDVVDEFDDEVGVEERARDVHVRVLDCGHDIVTAIRRPVPGRCPHAAADDCDCAPVIP